eukprot:7386921-Prymnesium_polylepis.1
MVAHRRRCATKRQTPGSRLAPNRSPGAYTPSRGAFLGYQLPKILIQQGSGLDEIELDAEGEEAKKSPLEGSAGGGRGADRARGGGCWLQIGAAADAAGAEEADC